jgi:hypothetical protein
MPIDNRVRITVQYRGQKLFFIRMETERIPLLADFESIHSAALLSRSDAVFRCQRLRAIGWDAHVVTPAGVVLFDDVLAPVTAPPSLQDRVPHQCNGILIVPGNPSDWYIRFPGTAIESIRGQSPDECYRKLVEHPLAAELLPQAEKFIPLPEPIVDPREAERKLQAARFGRLRRPDLEYN